MQVLEEIKVSVYENVYSKKPKIMSFLEVIFMCIHPVYASIIQSIRRYHQEGDPTSRLPAKSNKITTPNPIPYFQPLLIVTLFSTQRHGGTEFSITFTKVPYLCVHHSFSLQK